MELLQRLQRLEDLEAIRKLKYKYQDAVDSLWREGQLESISRKVRSLFTEDIEFLAPIDGGESVRLVNGLKEMEEFLATHHKGLNFAIHYVTNGLIELNGDTAEGQWNVFVPATGSDGVPSWYAARYVEAYRRTPSGWRISYSRQDVAFNTPFSQPWKSATSFRPVTP